MSETPDLSGLDEAKEANQDAEMATIPIVSTETGEIEVKQFTGAEVDEIAVEVKKGGSLDKAE